MINRLAGQAVAKRPERLRFSGRILYLTEDPEPISQQLAGKDLSWKPISSINRNFPGRSRPGQMYLASPLTVAASAVEGRIIPYRTV